MVQKSKRLKVTKYRRTGVTAQLCELQAEAYQPHRVIIIDAQEPEQPEPTKPPKLPKETGLKAIRRQGFLMFFAHGCELVYKVVRPDINEVFMFC